MATKVETLTIPVNSSYQWGHNPQLQAEYVNPVELNNRVIQLANVYTYITGQLSAASRQLGEAKKTLSDAEYELKDFTRRILKDHKPKSGDAQNNRMLDSYIYRVASEENLVEKLLELEKSVITAEKNVADCQIKVEVFRAELNNVELIGTHIQTHLSFVKAERKQV